MDIVCVGGGPAGLYFAILMKAADSEHRVRVYERNRRDDTHGFGVVFSDATLGSLRVADPPTLAAIEGAFAHWGDIHTHYRGEVVRSTGHGFSGLGRKQLLTILQARAEELGIELEFESELSVEQVDALYEDCDLLVAADGVNSVIRDSRAEAFEPEIDQRPNRFVWLGTTFPFEAFTFYFRENEHGLFRVHAYRYAPESSTFIVECTEACWRAAGLDECDEDQTIEYLEALFADDLDGHRLLKNRSIWRNFPTIKNRSWSDGHMVLLGDALHTAHFSIGSGTKLAMEDAVALRDALKKEPEVTRALALFEADLRPAVESLQRAAHVSLEWFENCELYAGLEPLQFNFSLLTRSLRITHQNLKLRDPELITQIDDWVARQSAAQTGREVPSGTPPMFTPFKLGGLTLDNRVVVSPMCQYTAKDGNIGDWQLVHLGSMANGGAGLVVSEATAVCPEGRITPNCAGIWTDEQTTQWRRVTDYVHTHTQAAIGIQLAHAGRKGATKIPSLARNTAIDDPWTLDAPSAIPFVEGGIVPQALNRAGMDRVRDHFVSAARRAEAAGFDLLELHCAHGYLLGSFISPLSNQRGDEYGGSLENRLRFPLEVLRAVREVWPDQKPVSVRISATDWAPGGLSTADLLGVGRALKNAGADIIDVSTGATVKQQQVLLGRLYQTPYSELVRLGSGVPTITVGAVSSWEDANSIIAGGRADLCALARGHLYDPSWTRHAAREQGYQLAWPTPYQAAGTFSPH